MEDVSCPRGRKTESGGSADSTKRIRAENVSALYRRRFRIIGAAMLRVVMFIMLFRVGVLIGSEIDVEVIARKCTPAVMLIVAAGADDSASLGTAFAITSDGKIVTNYHVIEGKDQLVAKAQNGGLFPIAKVIAADKDRDIAILQVQGRNLPYLELGDSNSVNPGAGVVVIGNPIGLEATVTQGIVSAKRQVGANEEVIQISAAISHGSSGSPVINAQGKVVGVATFKLLSGESLNFAIPTSEITRLLSQARFPTNAAKEAGANQNSSRAQDEALLKDPRFAVAKSLELDSKYVELFSLTKALVSEFPQSALSHRLLTDGYYYMGMVQDSIEQARISIKLDPKNPRGWSDLGNTLDKNGDVKGALNAYAQGVKLNPDDAKVLIEFGQAIATTQPEVAESAARHAEDLLDQGKGFDAESGVYSIYGMLTNLYLDLNKNGDAYRAAIKSVKAKPKLRDSWEALASAANANQYYDALEAIVSRAQAESKGDDSNLYYEWSVALSYQERWADALAAVRKAYAINPNNKDVLPALVQGILEFYPNEVPQETIQEINGYIVQLQKLDPAEGKKLLDKTNAALRRRGQ